MRPLLILIMLTTIACAKETPGDAVASSSSACTPLIVNGVQAEGWHEFAFGDVRWAKAYQCGECEKFVATTGAPTEDLRCD